MSARAAIADLELPDRLFIGGEWVEAQDGATIEVRAPAHDESLVEIQAAGRADVERAVAAARAQVDGGPWSRMPGAERGRLLGRMAELMRRDTTTLALLEAVDVGRPIGEAAHVEVPLAIETFEHYAGWADKIESRVIEASPHAGRSRLSYTLREPLGVVGAIVPWNAPTMISAWKLAPALAAGCAVVLKPSEEAPLTPMHLARLAEEAGFPPGVVNVVPGHGREAGAALAAHPGVDKVSFTGSLEVGRSVGVAAAADFRRATLELGGKSAQIVLADADLDEAIASIAIGVFANQGQMCAAGSRIFVQRPVYDAVVAGLAQAARAVVLGDPLDPGTTMGSLINRTQFDRVTGYVRQGGAEGARLVVGGGSLDRPGFFVEPTIFADGRNDMVIAREEIFGPVGLVIPFDEPDEALSMANDSRYGLATFIWTQSLPLAHRLAAGARSGVVWVNGFGPPDPRLPWGGLKDSGIGRELGLAGIEAHTDEKVVTVVL